jgi:hypothetical protein
MTPLKHTAYRWARLYIKFVRFLALLCLLAGATLFAVTFWKGSVAYRRTLYAPNPAIPSSLDKVMTQYRTASEILQSKGIAAVEITANISSVSGRAPRSSLHLQTMETVLTELRENLTTMRNRYSDAFSGPIDSLIGTLSEHARQVRSKLTPTHNAPAARAEGIAQSATPPQTPERARIYHAVSQSEIDKLLDVKDALTAYQTQTTKDTTRNCLIEAIKAVEMYAAVLQAELPVPITAPTERRKLEPQMPSVPKVDLRVDDLIRSLQHHKTLVQTVVLTDWQVETSLEGLLNLVHQEVVKSRDCELAGKERMIETGLSLAKVIFMALVGAFLTMVIADFLQAIIDTPDLIRGTREPKE